MSSISFSVITASYNSEQNISSAINSVAVQHNASFQHIFIDGGSTDGTLAIIRNAAPESILLSESDLGLYDALNKGISIASGDVIAFVHSDDLFFSENVLEQVAGIFENNEVDAVYGDLEYVNAMLTKTSRKWKSGQQVSFALGWMPPHPALFVRKSVFERVGFFRLDLGTAADYEWMLRAIHVNKINLTYLPKNLVKMRVGGMSNQGISSRKSAWKYDLLAWQTNGLEKNYFAVILKKLRKIPQFF